MRILPKHLKAERLHQMERQKQICPLCQTRFYEGDRIHLDHNHQTGAIRAALHGACNMALGKLERAARMTRDPKAFVANLQVFLDYHSVNRTGLIHPNHLTPEEKLAKQKRRAQKRRPPHK